MEITHSSHNFKKYIHSLFSKNAHLRLEKSVYQTRIEDCHYMNELPQRLITKTGYEAPGVKAGFISHLKINKIRRHHSHRPYGIPKCVAPGELPEGRRHYRMGTLCLKKVKRCAY